MNAPTETDRGQWTSASNAAADRKCQGRHLAQVGIPETKRPDADHGRAIHDALAKQDPSGLAVEQQDIYESCMAIERKVVMQFFGVDEETAAKSKPFREQRYWIHWKDELKHSAQPDCVHKAKTKALVIEYKTLPGDVPGSPENIQLRDQVCLLDHNYSSMLTEVGAVVIQPLVTHSPVITTYKREHITQSMKLMHERVMASNIPNAPRTPGKPQCDFCRAATAGVCIEYNNWAGSLIVSDQSILARPVAEWTPDQRAIVAGNLGVMTKWIEDRKADFKALLDKDPDSIPGWTLEDGNEVSTIINLQNVFERFSEMGGSLQQFMECLSCGKGGLKTAIAKVTKAKGKTLDAELKAVIGDDFTSKTNAPSIARKKK